MFSFVLSASLCLPSTFLLLPAPPLPHLAEAAFAQHLVQLEVVYGELVLVFLPGHGVQGLRVLLWGRLGHVYWGVPPHSLALWRGEEEEEGEGGEEGEEGEGGRRGGGGRESEQAEGILVG